MVRPFAGPLARAGLAALVALAPLSAPQAQAIDTLKMMVPANAGGGWDQTGRNLASAMQSANLVKKVTVDNKGGAGGTIGLAQFVNSAKGDPNAVMIAGMVMVGAIAMNNSPVNLTMVTPIARLTGEYEVLVVPANSPLKDAKDLLAKFKANPGSVSWGGGSAGGADHILAAMMAKTVGIDGSKVNYIPSAGGGEGTSAVLGGHVTVGIAGYGEYAQLINTGKLRALGVSSDKRLPGVNVPTLKEQGIDVELMNWRGIFGAPGITTEQKNALVRLVGDTVKSPAWQETLKKMDWVNLYLPGDEFNAAVGEETKRVTAIISDIGLAKK
jgi:putative tricarboxylic transport membrane protein